MFVFEGGYSQHFGTLFSSGKQ